MSGWTHPTMTPRQFADRLAELTTEEAGRPESWWWLSFADAELPVGKQFLGVALVRARGLIGATRRAHELGINPGGSVRGTEYADEPAEHLRDRLLSVDELVEASLIAKPKEEE